MKKLEKKEMKAVKGGNWVDDITKIGGTIATIEHIPDVIK